MSQSGILLFAHGARDPAWARPFQDVAQRLRARDAQVAVELAFLEFMAPTIVQAGQALAAQGCQRVTVVPLFLGAGGHVRKDLPVLLDQLAQQFPHVNWHLSPAAGETETVIEALAQASWLLSNHKDLPT